VRAGRQVAAASFARETVRTGHRHADDLERGGGRTSPDGGTSVNRSPRKALRQAANALDQLLDVVESDPDAKREVLAKVGDKAVQDLETIRTSLRQMADRLDGHSDAEI
jgi:hypothetical protein